jgi:hypothetical protein
MSRLLFPEQEVTQNDEFYSHFNQLSLLQGFKCYLKFHYFSS